MSCYFIISVFLEPGKDRADYDDYIKLVKPIVEEHGGKYVVRSEGIEYIGKDLHPDRFIMIWFPDRESIDRCFSSEKYRKIMSKGKIQWTARPLLSRQGRGMGITVIRERGE